MIANRPSSLLFLGHFCVLHTGLYVRIHVDTLWKHNDRRNTVKIKKLFVQTNYDLTTV